LLQPDIWKRQTSLDRVELTDELLQGVQNRGRRPVCRGSPAVAVTILVTVPGDRGRRSTLRRSKFTATHYCLQLGADRRPESQRRSKVDPHRTVGNAGFAGGTAISSFDYWANANCCGSARLRLRGRRVGIGTRRRRHQPGLELCPRQVDTKKNKAVYRRQPADHDPQSVVSHRYPGKSSAPETLRLVGRLVRTAVSRQHRTARAPRTGSPCCVANRCRA
jgi:hypothetical protein